MQWKLPKYMKAILMSFLNNKGDGISMGHLVLSNNASDGGAGLQAIDLLIIY